MDGRYSKVMDVNKLDLWSDNYALQKYEGMKDFYSQSLYYDQTIFGRPFIHFSAKGKEIIKRHESDFYDKLIIGSTYGYTAMFISCMVFLSLMILCSCCTCLASCGEKRDGSVAFGVLMTFLIAFTAVVFGLALFLYLKQLKQDSVIFELNENVVGDQYLNSQIKASYSATNGGLKKYLVIVILLGIALFLELLSVILTCVYVDKEKNEQSYRELH